MQSSQDAITNQGIGAVASNSIINEHNMYKQIPLPEFLISFEEYSMLAEPPMRNLHWVDTTHQLWEMEGRLLGQRQDHISRRDRENKKMK